MAEPKTDQGLPLENTANEESNRRREELQSVLHNPKFQQAVTAHRMFDMVRHSTDLYRRFPDFSPPASVLKDLESDTGGTKFILDDNQVESLGNAIQEGQDYIKSAWLYAAGEDAFGLINIASGHAIRSVPHQTERQETFQEKRESEDLPIVPHPKIGRSFRGVFIQLGGKYVSNYVMQLDAGASRDLYDHTNKDLILKQIVPQMYQNYTGWIDQNKTTKDSVLIVCNHNFQVEEVIKLDKYLNVVR